MWAFLLAPFLPLFLTSYFLTPAPRPYGKTLRLNWRSKGSLLPALGSPLSVLGRRRPGPSRLAPPRPDLACAAPAQPGPARPRPIPAHQTQPIFGAGLRRPGLTWLAPPRRSPARRCPIPAHKPQHITSIRRCVFSGGMESGYVSRRLKGAAPAPFINNQHNPLPPCSHSSITSKMSLNWL